MKYIIMGYDKRYSSKKHAEEYARFDNLAECLRYMNRLKSSSLSDTTEFFFREVSGYEIHSNRS